jgi:superfamily II DNA or RNA helicase
MAAPGAGKTLFAAMLARALMDAGLIDRVVHIVPNRALRCRPVRPTGPSD